MNGNNIFIDTDSYKVSQHAQYPDNATHGMVYAEARKGGMVRFFGLQAILDKIKTPTLDEVEIVNFLMREHFGRDDIFNLEGWKQIVRMGYLPLRVKAVKEGGLYSSGDVLFTVEPTHPDFVWLKGWFETQLMRVWYPTTVATNSYKVKLIIKEYLEKNGSPETIDFKLHDFGSRGASSAESAMIGGMAHLVNFKGTDTLVGIVGAMNHYECDPKDGLPGFSIPASEHSTVTAAGRDGEFEFYRKMINLYGGEGKMYACVSDSYNIWAALEMWKELEPEIIAKGGTLVIRPDSGHPVKTPVAVVERLIELFGCTLNDNGYMVLPDHIRVIQGDGVNAESIKEILEELDRRKISSDNIAFGMGGALLQKVDRDEYGFAIKMCGITVDGVEREVYKDPITDPGKTSKRGYIRDANLETVWENGKFLIRHNFEEVRNRA